MLIGIDAVSYNSSQKTGVEYYSYYLIRELVKIPSKNNFILYSQEPIDLFLPPNWSNKVLKSPTKYFWSQMTLASEMFIAPPDVLFVPSRSIPWNFYKKSVFAIQDLGYEFLDQAYSFRERNYVRLVYKSAVKWARHIIVPSEATKKDLITSYQAEVNKISVIPLGYDPEIFNVRKSRDFQTILGKYSVKKPYIFYLGRKEEKKNLINLIKAFRILRKKNNDDLQLVIAGKPGHGYADIKKEIDQTKNIIELDYAPIKETPIFYQEAEFFVLPSWNEGFGLPVLEAMACGCPVALSSALALGEAGGDAALYFAPDDAQQIAEVMSKFIENPRNKEEHRLKGLERIKNFSWRKCAERTMEVLERLV